MELPEANDHELINRIASFINEIGIECGPGTLPDATFLPGIEIQRGAIVFDPERLTYPGDLLHEAGHLAVLRPQHRGQAHGSEHLSGDIDPGAAEMAAIAWSWAAKEQLGLCAEIVFHSGGYRDGSESLIECFSKPSTGTVIMGVPMLQLFGMTKSPNAGGVPEADTYPKMISWIRQEK